MRGRGRRRPAVVRIVAGAVLAAQAAGAVAAADAGRGGRSRPPSLVVLIAVDQLRRDRLVPGLPGGLGRLAREGRVYVDARIDHAPSETCPGHASMLTGRHPGAAGIPANRWVDRESDERRYCVEDRSPDAAVIGGDDDPSEGRSPRSLRVPTLGDWLKAVHPESRVFTVSAKDRAAIPLGGHHPDGVYWLLREGTPGFTTSRYYRDALPDWARAWNAIPPASRIPATWVHDTRPSPEAPDRIDDYPGESDDYSRTSPHPLRDADPEELFDDVYHSPFVDEWTLSFARRLVEAEALGSHATPDLLAISLSATDTVGHTYGPESLEARDARRRLDAWLGEFLAWLEGRVGRDRLLVALTADHGVLPLPEWLAARGRLSCPLDGRVRPAVVPLVLGLYWELHRELSPWSLPLPWLTLASEPAVVRARARARGVSVDRVVAVAERWLEAKPFVREVWTRREIEQGRGEVARLYRHAFDPERSGDLIVQLEPTCVLDLDGEGTGHGSPYAYDLDVPIVFWGNGLAAERVAGPAFTVDVGPSLATRAGLSPPEGLDGRSLLAP